MSLTPDFIRFSLCQVRASHGRVFLFSITWQSDCPLIYCIIAELHFQMPSFSYFIRHFIRLFYIVDGGFFVSIVELN